MRGKKWISCHACIENDNAHHYILFNVISIHTCAINWGFGRIFSDLHCQKLDGITVEAEFRLILLYINILCRILNATYSGICRRNLHLRTYIYQSNEENKRRGSFLSSRCIHFNLGYHYFHIDEITLCEHFFVHFCCPVFSYICLIWID